MKRLLQKVRDWARSLPDLYEQKRVTLQAEIIERSREMLLTQLYRYRMQQRAKVYQVRGHSNSWRVEVDSFFHAYNFFTSLRETSEHQVKHSTKHSYYRCKMGDNSNLMFTDKVRRSSRDVATLHQTSTYDNTTILIIHFSPRK